MGVKVREKPRGSGGWWIFIDHQGKRKAKKVGDRKTAEAAAKKIEAKLVLGDFGLLEKSGEEGPQVPTLREYVRGFITRDGRTDPGWFERYAKLALKRSTWNVYDTLLDVHILPVLGERRLDEITPGW